MAPDRRRHAQDGEFSAWMRTELEAEARTLRSTPLTAPAESIYRDTALHAALREAIAAGDSEAERALRAAVEELGRERGRWRSKKQLHWYRHWLDSARFYVAFSESSGRAVLRLKTPAGLADWHARKWRRFRDPTIADVTESVRHLLRGALTRHPAEMALALIGADETGYRVVPFLPSVGPPADAVVVVDRGESRHTHGTLPHLNRDIRAFIGGAIGSLVWREAAEPMVAGSLCCTSAGNRLELDVGVQMGGPRYRIMTGAQAAGGWVVACERRPGPGDGLAAPVGR